MSNSETQPAEVFHVGDFIAEEMQARGWSSRDLAERMGGEEVDVAELTIDLTLAMAEAEDQRAYLGRQTAEGLERAFGVSANLWLHLDAAWHAWKVRNQAPGGVLRQERSAMKLMLINCKDCEKTKRIVFRPLEMTCIDLGRMLQTAIKRGDDVRLSRDHIHDRLCKCPSFD